MPVMRVKRVTTWLVLGLAVVLAYTARRRRGVPFRRAVPARGTPADVDPTTLGRGDLAGEQFVEAIAEWDLESSELEVAVTEPVRTQIEPDEDLDLDPAAAASADIYGDRRAPLGAGDLYGMHVVPAEDRELPDDDQAQDEGESWLEHLGASAAESGPEPEHEIDLVDESELHAGHHRTATTDTPVADLGSGGPRGL
jgi:hypothetical protein